MEQGKSSVGSVSAQGHCVEERAAEMSSQLVEERWEETRQDKRGEIELKQWHSLQQDPNQNILSLLRRQEAELQQAIECEREKLRQKVSDMLEAKSGDHEDIVDLNTRKVSGSVDVEMLDV
ncbi:hypothetical protein SVAN01_04907 [Stagonosporopsis vannaccii]|nr:hypothetical protein SVAN01_04907 [Stagonosporopsis vannaccii]